jgi:hypothetical protein
LLSHDGTQAMSAARRAGIASTSVFRTVLAADASAALA